MTVKKKMQLVWPVKQFIIGQAVSKLLDRVQFSSMICSTKEISQSSALATYLNGQKQ